MVDKITVDELKLFMGTRLKVLYPGNKVDGEEAIEGFFGGTVMSPVLKSVEKVGVITSVHFTKDSTWVKIGHSLHNCKSFCIGEEFKPIVRPWSNLTKEIEIKGEIVTPIENLLYYINSNLKPTPMAIYHMAKGGLLYHSDIMSLAEMHFDVFNWLNRIGEDGKPLAIEMED